MIHLEEITNKNIWSVIKLEPLEEQKEFVASNVISLAEAYATKNEGGNALPLAIYNDEELIGFVMIGFGTVGDEDEPEYVKNNYCIWRFMIDKKYQNKGYGKLSMDQVIQKIKSLPFGEAKKIWLSYDKENVTARELYKKFGFKENGDILDDEVVAIRDL